MDSKFHFTREISVLPTVLAIIGLLLTCWQMYTQSKFNAESRESYIGVRVDQYFDPKVVIVPGPNNFDPYVYRKKAKLTLSNNGFSSASIVSWAFYLPLDLEPERITLRLWVPGIEPELKSLDGKVIALPINIEPGKSKSFIVEYSIGITEEAYHALPQDYRGGKQVDWRSIEDNLSSVYKVNKRVEYLFELVKSDGVEIQFRFTNFGTNGFMLGERRPGMEEYVR